MHSLQSDPVLTVEDGRAGSFLNNELGLGLMWRVCSKASDVLENGKRLENLSWRLWNHQTQQLRRAKCDASKAAADHSVSKTSPLKVPDLSNSAESIASINSTDSALESPAASQQLETHTQPQQRKQRRARLLDRRVTPDDLDHLVHHIKEKQDLDGPLSPLPTLTETSSSSPPRSHTSHDTPRPSSPRPMAKHDSSASTVNTNLGHDSLLSEGSNTSATSIPSSHSVVRGFTPGTGVSSYTSKTQLAPLPAPILKSSAGSRTQLKKKGGMFLLGGSSGEDESSFRDRMSPRSQQQAILSNSLRSKKQTSFKEEVDEIDTKAQDDRAPAVFDSDDEDDYEDDDDDDEDLSEDVIDEDDDDAWEDEAEDDHTHSKPKALEFPRIDSSANLTSRRSQLTLALERTASQGNLPATWSTPTLRRSRNATPNGPSMPPSPEDDEESPLEMRTNPTRPRAILTTTNQQDVPSRVIPMSPRTTRQKMLAGEMTESFRKQLLWERKQRNVYSTHSAGASNATMRRAHTSADIPNMAREAGKTDTPASKEQLSFGKGANAGAKGVHWNHYFDNESMTGYHQKGW